MADISAYIILRDETIGDVHHRIKALVCPHRVTVRMDEIISGRGVWRTDVVTLTPEAMDRLLSEWQRIRTPKEAE